MPVDPAFLTTSPEWNIALEAPATQDTSNLDVDGVGAGSEFGSVLGKQIQALADLQREGSNASAALATGTATDPAETVMAVERARLSMQLASTLRTKGVEAVQEIFHTQV